MLAPGAQIDRYELVCPIGEGGMGQVWVARQRGKHGFEKLFALKAIHPRFADDPSFRAMFLNEARIVAAIEHPNVAQVFDLGEAGTLLYLVMEYVDGESVAALLAASAQRRAGAIVPLGVALRIAASICAGLHAAHRLTDAQGGARGVVHRDVSPQNILLSVRGDVKMIDFGIALAKDRAMGDTSPSTLKGKIGYMAPEQARREPVGPFTDVFSVGATLYRMLKGHAPFDGGADAATLTLLLSGAPPPPLPDHVPPAVSAIVQRALAADPADRYASAAAMQHALEGALDAQGFVPDVAAWVRTNLSDRARARRHELTQSTSSPGQTVPLAAPAPSPPRDESRDRSFMNVPELLAARKAEPAPAPRPVAPPPPQADAVPAQAVPQPPRPQTMASTDLTRRGSSFLKLAIGAIVFVLLALAVLLLLPMVVRDRVIANAHDAGVVLTIERVGVGFGGVSLRGVTAKVTPVPGFSARAEEIFASGFSGKEIRITGLEAQLDGAVSDVGQALVLHAMVHRKHAGGTAESPRHVSIVGARVIWSGVAGEGSKISASDVGAEIDLRGVNADELRGSVGRFEIKTPKTILGPWSASFEHAPATSRYRLLFDPPVPDGPSALVVRGATKTELTVKIPRSPFANLGIRPNELGLAADPSTEIEVKIDGEKQDQGRIEGRGKIDLFTMRLPTSKSPIDVKIDGALSGTSDKPLSIEKTTIVAGPFLANVLGTVTPYDKGLRLDATWKIVPLPCEKLARAEVKSWGPLAAAIQDLAHSTGALRVTGTANASGLVLYDTASPDDASFTWTTKETCGLSIFGH